jgi:hypothetical protein
VATKWARLREVLNPDGTRKYPDAPAADLDRALDPGYLEKLQRAKAPYLGKEVGDLLTVFKGFTEQKNELDERWKDINLELEAIGQLLKDHFQRQGVNSVKTESGKTVYLNTEPYAYVKKDQKQQFEARLSADPDLDYLWSVNFQTMNSWIKGLIENVQEDQIPPEVAVWLKTSVRIRES